MSTSTPPVALQLHSVRQDCSEDLPRVIAAVGEMGYDGVEFAGYHGHSATDIRKMLDGAGLKCCGTHTGLDTLMGDALPATVEFNQTLGNRFLIVPGLPKERTASRQAWLDTAALFNELAEKVRPDGMRVGYHNHTIEFRPLDGELPWDTFFGHTVADVVMQVDTGNCLHGGGDPIAALRKYPGRAATVHLKEFSANPKALIGEGDVKWSEVFQLCEAAGGTEWYIIEQESYAFEPIQCVRRCLENYRKMRQG